MIFGLSGCSGKKTENTQKITSAPQIDRLVGGTTTEAETTTEDTLATTTESEPTETEAVNYEGILVQSVHVGDRYFWKSTGTYMCDVFTVNLDYIDPQTGDITHFKTFSSENTHSCSYQYAVSQNVKEARLSFNADFSAMIASLTEDDGAEHIGWIDEDGAFFDVSEKITHKSDFGAITKHSQPCFWGNYMYFCDQTDSVERIKRVPLDNLQESAVEVMWEGDGYEHTSVYPKPDGSLPEQTNSVHWYEYPTADAKYGATVNNFGGWLNSYEYVSADNGKIVIYSLEGFTGSQDLLNWYSKKTPIVPDVNGRASCNPVLSPDGKQVAFVSQVNTTTELFIVDVTGGNPVKVNTDYDFSSVSSIGTPVALIGWHNEEGKSFEFSESGTEQTTEGTTQNDNQDFGEVTTVSGFIKLADSCLGKTQEETVNILSQSLGFGEFVVQKSSSDAGDGREYYYYSSFEKAPSLDNIVFFHIDLTILNGCVSEISIGTFKVAEGVSFDYSTYTPDELEGFSKEIKTSILSEYGDAHEAPSAQYLNAKRGEALEWTNQNGRLITMIWGEGLWGSSEWESGDDFNDLSLYISLPS